MIHTGLIPDRSINDLNVLRTCGLGVLMDDIFYFKSTDRHAKMTSSQKVTDGHFSACVAKCIGK
jgi:hypothetical protein